MTDACAVYNSAKWIEENQADFAPPICNKCMFSDQLKVFFVGGPNSRKDYHLEEGEEVFYQIQGDMVLKVIEQGLPKDIHIKQGEIFLLPSRIEHSPQRFANTIGCVIERTRRENEFDCLRYFVDGTTEVLWERFFHLEDVVKDLPPYIKQFHASEEFKSGKPGSGTRVEPHKYEVDSRKLDSPIPLDEFVNQHLVEINSAPYKLYGSPQYTTEVLLYGNGKHRISTNDVELIVMPQRGKVSIEVDGKRETLQAFHIGRILPGKNVLLDVDEGGICITVRMA
uniref:3-hydroxyanthranilate 3,4-dioxygenase n=1 Tax=Acrobeloides nanus TaxID=290746 RepID=A0A914CX97_9BILA